MDAHVPPIPAAPFSVDQDSPAPAHELPRTETGLRVLYSLVFAAILHIVVAMLTVLVTIQVVYSLITRKRPHIRLGDFGAGLSRYCTNVFGYLTHNEDRPPFPFDDLPDDTA